MCTRQPPHRNRKIGGSHVNDLFIIYRVGAALVISSSAVWQLLTSRSVAARFQSRSPMLRVMASEVAAGSSGLQAVAGLAVIVLGILAIAGIFTGPLTLIALLVAGAALVLTGSTLSATMTGFMRPTGATARITP